MARQLAQLDEHEGQQRSIAQQAQQDASRLQGETESLSEVLAQRDADLEVTNDMITDSASQGS